MYSKIRAMYSSIETEGFEKLWWGAVRYDMVIKEMSGALVGNWAGRVGSFCAVIPISGDNLSESSNVL